MSKSDSEPRDVTEYAGIVIYDGDCPYCSAISKVLEKLDNVGVVPWQDDISQDFLRVQFGQVPFAMFFVDYEENKIYAGSAASKELADRAGMPGMASKLISDNYDKIASIVGLASRRSRETDDYHETYELREEAREKIEELDEYATDSSVANLD